MSGVLHRLRWRGQDMDLSCERRDAGLVVVLGEERIEASIVSEAEHLVVEVAGEQARGVVHVTHDRVLVSYAGRVWAFDRTRGAGGHDAVREVRGGDIEAPMTGTVLEVLCAAGDAVEAGTPLVVVEAMKMEHRLAAPRAGTVASVDVQGGELVDIGQILVRMEPR